MGNSFLRVLPVFLGSMFACGLGTFIAMSRLSLPVANQQAADPGAYIVTGLLGATVLISFGIQERRIQELERQLRQQKQDAGGPASTT